MARFLFLVILIGGGIFLWQSDMDFSDLWNRGKGVVESLLGEDAGAQLEALKEKKSELENTLETLKQKLEEKKNEGTEKLEEIRQALEETKAKFEETQSAIQSLQDSLQKSGESLGIPSTASQE
ncbi:hypothetical protein K9L63_01410 [Candidatus Gracilibacteria bacterium]|nr:hypothetical protein [Candidatus Gracilibacteria bacterium]